MKQYIPVNPQNDRWDKMYITQEFWANPEYYSQYWILGHEGIDINTKVWTPTPVYAAFDGNTYITNEPVYGKRVKLYDDIGLQASYCHMESIYVERAERVKKGQFLWFSWNTWISSGVHVHFMLKECNPVTWEIYNTDNWYFWSIPVYFDIDKNALWFDTEKDYKLGEIITNPDCSIYIDKLNSIQSVLDWNTSPTFNDVDIEELVEKKADEKIKKEKDDFIEGYINAHNL